MSRRVLNICNFQHNLVRYKDGLQLQEAVAAARKSGDLGDVVLLLQHHPVFTVGKRGSLSDFKVPPEELRARGIDVEHIPRGGETTFHGPGQLVAYPILDLRASKLGARAFVEGLEDMMIRVAGAHGVQARGRVPGLTGVWVGDRKIGAVGVRISHGISSHGIALNINTDLSYFSMAVPCGITDKQVTSLSQELGRESLPLVQLSQQLQQAFVATFKYKEMQQLEPQQLKEVVAQTQK